MIRYIFAILISISGITASYIWLKPAPWTSHTIKQKKTLAYLISSSGEVRKKSHGKLIWAPVVQGDPLYESEMLKTRKNGFVKIKFIISDTIIELGESSTIIIEKFNNELSLNVLAGRLFVDSVQKDKKHSSVTIKSGNKSVKLKNGKISFSVDKKGDVGVQVISGKAEVKSDNKIVTLTRNETGKLSGKKIKRIKNKFNNVSPAFGENIYLDNGVTKSKFSWTPLPSGYSVVLEIGTTASKLKRAKIKSVSGESGELTAPIRYGKFYWKLVALPTVSKSEKNKLNSIIYQNNFLLKKPPVPLYPVAGEEIVVSRKKGVTFNWSNRIPFQNVTLEISNSIDFKKILFSKKFENRLSSYESRELTTDGTYYWRLTGLLNKRIGQITSKIKKFFIQYEKRGKAPPLLAFPLQDEEIYLDGRKTVDITLKWKKSLGTRLYKFIIRGSGELKQFKVVKDTAKQVVKLNNLAAGKYFWKVGAAANEKAVAVYSRERSFTIGQLPEIQWKYLKPKYHFSSKGESKVQVKWSKNSTAIAYWEVRIGTSMDFTSSTSHKVFKPDFTFHPPKEAIFYIQVTALDGNKKIIGKSKPANLQVKRFSVLEPPRFHKSISNPIRANESGRTKLLFSKTNRKNKLLVEIKNFDGKIIQQTYFKSKGGVIKNLMPGQYWVSAKEVDQNNRTGIPSEARQLIVPKTSKITAPEVKGIKIR